MSNHRIAGNFGGQNFGEFPKNRFLLLIFWQIVAKADRQLDIRTIVSFWQLKFGVSCAIRRNFVHQNFSLYDIPYSRFFSLAKYFVSQILAGSNFRHRATSQNILNRQKEFFEM